MDDSIEFFDKARAANVRATLTIEPGGIHIYPQLDPDLPESRAAIAEIIRLRFRKRAYQL